MTIAELFAGGRIGKRLVIAIILISSAITIFTTAFQLFRDYQRGVSAIELELKQASVLASESLALSVWVLDGENIQTQIEGLARLPNVTGLRVVLPDGTEWKTGQNGGKAEFVREYPLEHVYKEKRLVIGKLVVHSTLDRLYAELIDAALTILLSNAIKTFLVAGIALALCQAWITRHLTHLAREAASFRVDGDPSPITLQNHSPSQPDELDELTEGMNRAVSQARELFRQQIHSEQRFRDFAGSTSDWLWETDEENRFTYMSDRLEDVIGVPASHFIGRPRWELPNAILDSKKTWEDHMAEIEARRPFRGFEYAVKNEAGEIIHLSVSGVPAFDAQGRFTGYRGTGTNVTSKHQAEIDVLNALETAVAANRAKSEFLASMSHELRTPLNAILGFAQAIQSETFGPVGSSRYKGYIDDICEAGSSLLDLVNELLDLGQVEAGKVSHNPEQIDVSEIIEEAVETLSGGAANKSVDVEVRITAVDSRQFFADRDAIRRCLLNLLSNAIKYSEPGRSVRVVARDHDEPGFLYISVSDDGPGIDPATLARLGEPFFTSTEPMTSGAGVGLGLSICKALVQRHNGRLEIESVPGCGTTAMILLPVKAAFVMAPEDLASSIG